MLSIILFYIREHIKSYAIAMLLLSILFILCGISYENLLTVQTEFTYTDSLKDSFWIYPQESVQRDDTVQGTTACAYQQIVETEKGEKYACLFLEELLSANFLVGLEGRNLSYSSGANEVILYGEALERKYAVGDTIYLNGTDYQIVGKLPTYMPIWEMFLYSRDIDIDNAYVHAKNGNMFLINNKNIYSNEKSDAPSCVFSSRKLSQRKDGISMKKAKKELFRQIKERQLFEGTSILLLFFLAGYFCLVLSIVQYKKTKNLFGILVLTGMGRMKCFCFLLVNSLCIIGGAILLYLFYAALFAAQDYYDERFWQGQRYILVSLSAYIFCILLGFHLWEYRNSVLQLLKEG